MTQPTSKRESALHLAAKGFDIIPVTENQKKPPLIKGWQSAATRDPKQLTDTWEYAPNLNIGCCITDGFSLSTSTSRKEVSIR